MRIVHLTPGTGHFVCGSCLRDHALCEALRAQGHQVDQVPLYLPFVLEDENPVPSDRVFLGGVNMYLQQKASWWHRLPASVRRWLDRPSLLRLASRRGDFTASEDLGALTVSTLRGKDGRQAGEFEDLMRGLAERGRPDRVVLSNAMLAGAIRPLREILRAPVAVTLQGEAPFLDSLPDPYRAQAWDVLREEARHADSFLAVSGYTAELMTERLALDPAKVHVVWNGIEADHFQPASAPPAVPTVGYLARLSEDKGLPTLVEAFLELRRRPSCRNVRLRVGGTLLASDRRLLQRLQKRVAQAGLAADVDFLPDLSLAQKQQFLQGLSVLSVPATYGESFGLYLLEAWASGVPVVQPRHAAFPELLEATGGGLLCEPNDPVALADGLQELLDDPARATQMGLQARERVCAGFTAARMAERVQDAWNPQTVTSP